MRIVLDTNVLASALISPHGFSHELAERWEAGEFTLVTSAEQREELRRVLAYPRLQKRIDEGEAARRAPGRTRGRSMTEGAQITPPRLSVPGGGRYATSPWL